MYDDKLFQNWKMIYENSEDISLLVTASYASEEKPRINQIISTKELKSRLNEGVLHIDLLGGWEFVVHAVKDNMVYVTLFERSAETAWVDREHYCLSQIKPNAGKMIERKDRDNYVFMISVKEWGGIKSGVRYKSNG